MTGSPQHYHSNVITVYNGTGSTIAVSRGLTITKNSAGDLGVALSAVDVRPNCVSLEPIADGEFGPAVLTNQAGIISFTAAGALSAGTAVTAAASGKISSGGSAAVGKNIDASTTDGDVIRVLVS